MKPASFEYVAPPSIEAALGALAAGGGEARVLAGGQTLGPLLNMRLAAPRCLVDIGRIAALKRLETNADTLFIGAGNTHAAIEDGVDPSTTGRLLSYVASKIAYRAIRTRGTIGGSLAHADPAADWIATILLLDAVLTIAGPSGSRRVTAPDFMTGVFSTAIGPSDILSAIELPRLSTRARWGYYKVCRKIGEFPEAIGAAVFDPERGMNRVVAGALDGPPVFLATIAEAVAREGGAAASMAAVSEAIQAAAPGIDPIDLRVHVASVRRAVFQAIGP
ncbi:MAG TPA: FAD binding domain-containing protein [Alphaproteobacteria bacterium]|nr:FAD binding domain-containing protein [Alphaproteobacteria bacterium]